MSNKYIGFPTQLKRGNGDGPPETFTAIAGIRVIDPPKGTSSIVESTTMDNPDAFRQKLSGLRDGGQATLQLAFDPADTGHQNIIKDWVAGTLRNWQVILSDTGATVFALSAFVKDCQPKAPIDGLLILDCNLEVSGKPTFGAFA